jgi:hypothetical protein
MSAALKCIGHRRVLEGGFVVLGGGRRTFGMVLGEFGLVGVVVCRIDEFLAGIEE